MAASVWLSEAVVAYRVLRRKHRGLGRKVTTSWAQGTWNSLPGHQGEVDANGRRAPGFFLWQVSLPTRAVDPEETGEDAELGLCIRAWAKKLVLCQVAR